jgi:hypothetical protein
MSYRQQVKDLFRVMVRDQISQPQKVDQLKKELQIHHRSEAFTKCRTMGDIVFTNLKLLLQKDFRQSIEL